MLNYLQILSFRSKFNPFCGTLQFATQSYMVKITVLDHFDECAADIGAAHLLYFKNESKVRSFGCTLPRVKQKGTYCCTGTGWSSSKKRSRVVVGHELVSVSACGASSNRFAGATLPPFAWLVGPNIISRAVEKGCSYSGTFPASCNAINQEPKL